MTGEPLDLLYVRSLFRPEDFGGNRYPWEVTRRLAARGHRVRVITPRPSGPLPATTGAETRWYPASRRSPLATFATNALFSRLTSERERLRSRPDLVVLSSYETAYGNYAIPGGVRTIPSVYIYHGRFLSDAIERLRAGSSLRARAGRLVHSFSEHVERLALTSARTVVAVSPFSVAEIERRTGRREGVELIPTGVDVDLFRPGDRAAARQSLGLAESDRVLVTVGRLSPVKRYDRAIDTLATLRRDDPRYQLLIVGDGPELAALRAHAVALGVSDAVRFEGFRDGPELVKRLWAANIQLCTSDFENWSLALLEGFASGCLVVGVPRGGIPQLIGLVNAGLVAQDASAEALAATVRAVFDRADLAELAARGARVVREGYGWESVVDRLEDAFRRASR